MKQTGFLFKYDPKDYRVGASPLITPIVNESGNWTEYQPSGEKQYKDYAFDTMSCTTFSHMNDIETTVDFFIAHNILTTSEFAWLTKNGYFENGKLNVSDRFIAILSGTTDQGNYTQKVGDAVRNYGLIPEKDLPFGGNNIAEYLNKNVITQAMLDKGQAFLAIFETNYEWTSIVKADIDIALKACPLQVVINSGTHAVELISNDHIFDSYPPYLIPIVPLDYALKIIIKRRVLLRTLKLGMKGLDVTGLQSDLKALGYVVGVIDGSFGAITQKAVKALQTANKLVSDGVAGAKTLAKIIDLKKNLKTKTMLEKWIEGIKDMEGAKPERNNIGNLRFIGQKYAINDNGFCKFDTYEHGYEALKTLLVNACTGKSKVYSPDMTLLEFYEKYAPSSDNNNPKNYATFVATRIGCTIDTKIKTLI